MELGKCTNPNPKKSDRQAKFAIRKPVIVEMLSKVQAQTTKCAHPAMQAEQNRATFFFVNLKQSNPMQHNVNHTNGA